MKTRGRIIVCSVLALTVQQVAQAEVGSLPEVTVTSTTIEGRFLRDSSGSFLYPPAFQSI